MIGATLGSGTLGSSSLGGALYIEDADLALLRKLVPDRNDARYLFQAIKGGGVYYFVTADVKTIVRYAPEIEAAFPPLLVRKPSQLVTELPAANSS